MKLDQLLEMPQAIRRNLGDDPDDDHEPMTSFFMTNEQFANRYTVVGMNGNTIAGLAKDLGGALVGVRGPRKEDQVEGVHIYGQLHFKDVYNLGFPNDPLRLKQQRVLQVSLVNVVKDTEYRGLASFLYTSIAGAGFTIISDTTQYNGGIELWKKLGRARPGNLAIYLINKGDVLKDEQGKPIEYNGSNIPEDQIWSEDETNKFVLFVLKQR